MYDTKRVWCFVFGGTQIHMKYAQKHRENKLVQTPERWKVCKVQCKLTSSVATTYVLYTLITPSDINACSSFRFHQVSPVHNVITVTSCHLVIYWICL